MSENRCKSVWLIYCLDLGKYYECRNSSGVTNRRRWIIVHNKVTLYSLSFSSSMLVCESVFQLVNNHEFYWLSNSSTPVFVFVWCLQSPVISKSKFHAAMIVESFAKCLERRRGVWWAIMDWFQEPATWRRVNALAESLCRTHVDHVGWLNHGKK